MTNALAQEIRVFPRRTKWTPDDPGVYIGDPPLFRPSQDLPIRISVVFTWDIEEAFRLKRAWEKYYSTVQVSGPALDSPGDEFTPGRFIKQGVTITSRGCPRKCPWCFVPKREGIIRELIIQDGWIVQDNNLLACSRKHIEAVFEMLSGQNRSVEFKGGIDPRLLKQWHVDLFNQIKVKEIWISFDSWTAQLAVERSAALLSGYPINKKRCFVLIGFNGESVSEAEDRLERVYSMGFLPFAQLYQNENRKTYSTLWRNLARKWSRPAAYRSKTP